MKTYDWRKDTNYDGFAGCVLLLAGWVILIVLTLAAWGISLLIKSGL